MVRFSPYVLLGLGLWGAGCASDTSPPAPCSDKPHATFHLEIAADDGPLPPDTHLRVSYGGSAVESFDLAAPHMGSSIFCTADYADASGSRAQSIGCDLWTNGPANLDVWAAGYADVHVALPVVRDACGISLSTVSVPLDRAD